MTLGDLIHALEAVCPVQNLARLDAAALAQDVTGVSHDSRQVGPGSVFVALKGQRLDGSAFAAEALAKGAAGVLSEGPPPEGSLPAAPWFIVADARRALAAVAAAFYRRPSEELIVVGVTGTNGKTTTTHLVSGIFEAAGVRCGRLGTISYRIGTEERSALHTTPEASDIQRMLREMVDRRCGACAMEVSSHALVLRRVDDIRFAAAIFTNLTRDHLDFHGDLESYFQAKRRLFEMLPAGGVAVLNLDDPRGVALAGLVKRPVTYAADRPAAVTPAGPVATALDGLTFDVRTPRGTLHIRSRLVGRPNVYNILASVATAVALDLPFNAIESGVTSVESVPGRFQVVSDPAGEVTVVVDYAHTDDALRNLLETVRPLATGRLITVFGCGGDRDRTKRPLMGAVAARLSDVVVLTSDNPRSEDPLAIIEEIQRGIAPGTGRVGSQPPLQLVIVDRRTAIERAIRDARSGDVVLIAGKGHEQYQVVADRHLPFDDVAEAQAALARRRRANSQAG